MLFGAIYKKIKRQIPEDFKETIKIANLDPNEILFKKYLQWNQFFASNISYRDKEKTFQFKSFESKKDYNYVIGNLLKLYINQGRKC